MKKFIIVLLAAVLGLSMTSCLTKTKATVKVTVTDALGMPVEGETVYMFTTASWDAVRLPANAEKRELTNKDGVATFNIQGIYLDVIDNTATLYFAVFEASGDKVRAYKAVAVKAGDNKEVEIELDVL